MYKMSPDQEDHIDTILDDFIDEAKPKYELGAFEHATNLWEYSPTKLLEFLNEEVIDMVMYFYTMRPKMEALIEENKQLKQHITDLKERTID